jgi:hypothetical protein
MNRIDKVKAVAEKHGATLGEYLALHIATAFPMRDEEAANLMAKALAGSAHANIDCHAAIQNCFYKAWMERTPAGMLALTRSGRMVAHEIAGELTEP